MQISFFEEFPTKDNLSKISHITFPTKIYLGAKSLEEFSSIEPNSRFVKEKIYWPILDKKEGYWLSPFSKREAILRTINELKSAKHLILWDAELPTFQNPVLYFTQLPFFFSNRRMIREFIASSKNISTAEYFPSSKIMAHLFNFLGLSFQSDNHYPIKMVYSSMHDFGEFIMRREIKLAQKLYGGRLRIGLGTLTHGILGTEPPISSKLLDRDLSICKELGITEVILFRLGGINKSYAKILKKYV